MRQQPLLFRPAILLRAEALLVFVIACAAYNHWFPHHWVLFARLFLVPDLSLIPYLRGPGSRASIVYNSFHSYILPALLGALSLHNGSVFFEETSLIWISHIGLDRILGYGLKYSTSFAFTHLQSTASVPPQSDQ